MSAVPHKPLCPCCQQAYAATILSGDAPAAATGDAAASPIARFMLCHSCEPSDVEKALASKAQTDKTVPPIVWDSVSNRCQDGGNRGRDQGQP